MTDLIRDEVSQTVYLYLQDATTGLGKTGLVYNTSGLTVYYTLPLGTPTAISLVTLGSITASWSSGGFLEADATHAPGLYRLDLPNAACAAVPFVVVKAALTGSHHGPQTFTLVPYGFAHAQKAVAYGVVGSSASTTSIPTSTLVPADTVAGEFLGKTLTFRANTTTAALRSQSTVITATNGAGTLTVTALTTSPASGDTFIIT